MDENVSAREFQTYLLGIMAPATATKYSAYTSVFLRLMAQNGYESFTDLPRGILSEIASSLSRGGAKPATVRVNIYAIQRYLRWVRGKGVSVTSLTQPDLPKPVTRIRPILSVPQLTEYFGCADRYLEEPYRTAAMMLPCAGLRASEMAKLRLKDIHRAEIKLADGSKKKTLFLKIVGKGNKERAVPLMEEGVEIITGYLAGWRKEQKGTWVFPKITLDKKTAGLKPIGARYLRKALQQLREAMDESFTPHTMRRTYITVLHRKKVDLAVIAKIAGHANVQTTINHYIAMDSDDAIRALHDAGSSLTE